MVKLGNSSGIIHQRCHCHGLHLAVCVVVYKKNMELVEADPDIDVMISDDEMLSDDAMLSKDDYEEDAQEEEITWFEFNEGDADFTDTYNLSSSIEKVREIANFFRRSPFKNDLLQAKVKKEIGKELHFILDTKTRWEFNAQNDNPFRRIEEVSS